MKGRAFIDFIWRQRDSNLNVPLPESVCQLIEDMANIADEAAGALIECKSLSAGDWWDTRYAINGLGDYNEVDECDPINKALSYLDRRGLIERKEGEPHLVRFVKEA